MKKIFLILFLICTSTIFGQLYVSDPTNSSTYKIIETYEQRDQRLFTEFLSELSKSKNVQEAQDFLQHKLVEHKDDVLKITTIIQLINALSVIMPEDTISKFYDVEIKEEDYVYVNPVFID